MTINVRLSGIHIEDGRVLMLHEGDMPIKKQDLDQNNLRRVEILKHLPIAIAGPVR